MYGHMLGAVGLRDVKRGAETKNAVVGPFALYHLVRQEWCAKQAAALSSAVARLEPTPFSRASSSGGPATDDLLKATHRPSRAVSPIPQRGDSEYQPVGDIAKR